ncbi:hypothetical protein RUESEDTHA_03838 [Ruegeria sp. THAF57]|nr:hypothetical protein RUESEDTHA_03838 [Ruegeria sp. THAF57]
MSGAFLGNKMKTNHVGNTDLKVTEPSFGCASIGAFFGNPRMRTCGTF